jgi:Leucine-rich repeat (LRR) protein
MDLNTLFPEEYKGHQVRKHLKTLIISSSDYRRQAKFYKNHKYERIEINPEFHAPQNLEFLGLFDNIKGLKILTTNIVDFKGIYYHKNLVELVIDYKQKASIDFGQFKNLKECLFTWGTPGSDSIFECSTLEKLRIDNLSKVSEFWKITNFSELRELELVKPSIVNLNGICELNSLTTLEIYSSRSLDSLEHISKLMKLEMLTLNSCKKIHNLHEIGQCNNLKRLYLVDLGTVNDVLFADNLNLLEFCHFGITKFENGNLEPLFNKYKNGNLKECYFKNARHYSRKSEDFGLGNFT